MAGPFDVLINNSPRATKLRYSPYLTLLESVDRNLIVYETTPMERTAHVGHHLLRSRRVWTGLGFRAALEIFHEHKTQDISGAHKVGPKQHCSRL